MVGTHEISRGQRLDNLATIHDDDAVAETRDHRQIVTDQEQAHPLGVAQILQQLENLRLHG
jgi:hypothetical protein